MEKILDRPTTKLFVDYKRKVVLGHMTGDILFEDYKEMLLGGAELATNDVINCIILDRRNILKQDAECRIWVKNYYLKEHVKPIVHKIRRVAIVESKSMVGQIYGRTIFATLSMIYPNLKMKSFSDIKKAREWVAEADTSKQLVIDEVINDEKNFFNDVRIFESSFAERTNESPAELVTSDGKITKNSDTKDSSLIGKFLKYFFPN